MTLQPTFLSLFRVVDGENQRSFGDYGGTQSISIKISLLYNKEKPHTETLQELVSNPKELDEFMKYYKYEYEFEKFKKDQF